MNSLSGYLSEYYKYNQNIVLVYRTNKDAGYPRGVIYLGENYNPLIKYNHRVMLPNEVVIEYDLDNIEHNKKLIDEVSRRLKKDGFKTAKWYSGNKSTHLHLLINVGECINIPLLKRVLIRYYTKNLPIPDLQLCGNNHLIRAEYGLHEKTGRYKELISKDKDYPCISEVPKDVWELYYKEVGIIMNRKVTIDTKEFEQLPGIQYLFKTEEFKKYNDGRKRGLLLLIFALKDKYTKREELVEYLYSWYKYNLGTDLDKKDIDKKVYYYTKVKNYPLTFWVKYLNELLEDIGLESLIVKKEEQKTL
jgi:hypothetical protein